MFECVICKRSFTGSKEFDTHFEYFHKENSVDQVEAKVSKYNCRCNICGTNITSRDGITKHMKESHGQRRFKCEYCSSEFTQKHHLQKHIQGIHSQESGIQPNSVKCEFCDMTIKFKNEYKNHINRVHRGIKEYECNLCGKAFSISNTLKKHMNIEHANMSSNNKFPCEICNSEFTRPGSLQTHMATVHSLGKIHPCNQCDKVFQRIDGLRRHVSRVHEKMRHFKCEFCEKEFFAKKDFILHVPVHQRQKTNESKRIPKPKSLHSKDSDNRYQCELCEKQFSFRQSLTKHFNEYHVKEKEALKCLQCNKKFDYRKDLTQHVNVTHLKKQPKIFNSNETINFENEVITNSESYVEENVDFDSTYKGIGLKEEDEQNNSVKCEQGSRVGSKIFRSNFLISKEGLVVKDSKNVSKKLQNNLKCDLCEKVFHYKKNLKNHFQRHHNEIKFSCTFCDKQFAYKLNLARHMEDHTNLKPQTKKQCDYECDICGKAFKSLNTFSTHRATIHLNKELFECKKCTKQFKQSIHLKRHIKLVHEVHEKNYRCETCNKSCSLKANLLRHIKESHQSPKVKCNFCDMTFVDNKRNLKRHILRAHKDTLVTKDRTLEDIKNEKMCNFCSKTFCEPYLESKLRLHVEAVHDGKRNYHCKFCDKSYKQLHHLKYHQRNIHANHQSKVKCDICQKEFSEEINLRSHMKLNHHEISRKCEFCQKYIHQSQMKQHQQMVHRNAVLEF